MSTLTNEIKSRLAKVYELVNAGATEGERAAAKKALDRIVSKHNVSAEELASLNSNTYIFTYSTMLELHLLGAIMKVLTENAWGSSYKRTWNEDFKPAKQVVCGITYMEWVTIESAYEYFRRHMKQQWQKICIPELNKCRKTKTRNKRRKELEGIFMSKYLIASKLYKPEYIENVTVTNPKEILDRARMKSVEGGTYNRQVTSGLMLQNF